jgi:hypothetical protein
LNLIKINGHKGFPSKSVISYIVYLKATSAVKYSISVSVASKFNVDKLYGGSATGTTSASAAAPPPPPGGAEGGGAELPPPPPAEGGGVTPESVTKDNLNILLESDSLIEEESFIDLSKARNSLGEMETQLKKLLRD